MTTADAIAALDAIDVGDPERAHSEADEILAAVAPGAVRDAYFRVSQRAGWWAAA